MKSNRPGTEEIKRLTEEHFSNPRVGDMFEEMFTCWLWVLKVEPKIVVSYRCGENERQIREFEDIAAFKRAYAYGSIPGYFMHFYTNKPLPPSPATRFANQK